MKKIFIAALAVCAVFASCSKDSNEGTGTQANSKDIIITLADGVEFANPTRAVEAPAVAGTTTITNLTVFLLSGNDGVLSSYDFTASPMAITAAPAATTGFIIVANATSAELTALKLLTTGAAIKSYPFTIATQSASAGIAGKVHMSDIVSLSGATVVPGGGASGADLYQYTTPIALNSLTCRFEIPSVTNGTGISDIQIEGVWMNNYFLNAAATAPTLNPTGSPVWTTTPATNVAGSATALTPVTIPAYPVTAYFNSYNSSVGTGNVYAYTLFAGAYVPQLIILVSGQYTGGQYFLGYVTYSKFDNGSDIIKIDGNKIYKVNNLSPIVINDTDLTTRPSLNSFDLRIPVTLTPWTVENVTPGI